jgi:hypothetical protein
MPSQDPPLSPPPQNAYSKLLLAMHTTTFSPALQSTAPPPEAPTLPPQSPAAAWKHICVVCVCVCMYVCVLVCVCMCVCVCACVCECASMCVHVCMCVCECAWVCRSPHTTIERRSSFVVKCSTASACPTQLYPLLWRRTLTMPGTNMAPFPLQ